MPSLWHDDVFLCSDDLVQLCVDYLKEYPLLVTACLALPVCTLLLAMGGGGLLKIAFAFYSLESNYTNVQEIIFVAFDLYFSLI